MKISTRRFRRRPSSREAIQSNKDNRNEHLFFGESGYEPFFKPVSSVPSAETVNRKCDDCEKEEKKVKRVPEEKKDEKKLNLVTDKKEEKKLMKKEEKKEEKKDKIQKKESGITSENSSGKTSNYINSINGKGQHMDAGLKKFFGRRMNSDFANVKIHTGKEAADSAKEINAQAYNYGNHIVFNEGEFRPETNEGMHLLAHELTHFLQQTEQTLHRREIDGSNTNSESAPSSEVMPEETENLPGVFTSGIGTNLENNIGYANCRGINVSGNTVANYDHGSFSANSTSVKRAKNCSECEGDECVTVVGNITSVFQAGPQVTLPDIPPGLNECENNAVQTFINGTLTLHEQKHVNAFNTYNGSIVTPFRYTGCRDGIDAYILSIHNRIDAARIVSANTKSKALDPFNPVIPCNCPDAEPQS